MFKDFSKLAFQICRKYFENMPTVLSEPRQGYICQDSDNSPDKLGLVKPNYVKPSSSINV